MRRPQPTPASSALVGADGPIEEAEAGDAVEVILDRTPFYGESGGQIGDTGSIRTETGSDQHRRHVQADARRLRSPRHRRRGVHARPARRRSAKIDAERRRAIRRNHTATHLLHRALRMVLGEETQQAGSLVAPDRLRFDFTSLEAMTADQLARISRDRQSRDLQATSR